MIYNLSKEITQTEDNVFFIVGSGRSGTTLLKTLIDCHSKICLPMETHFYTTYRKLNFWRYRSMNRGNYKKAIDEIFRWRHVQNANIDWDLFHNLAEAQNPSWHSIFIAFLTAYRIKYDKKIVGEKTPGHIRNIKELNKRFDKAKFIHLIRDPRAVVSSYLNHSLYQKIYNNNISRASLKWRKAAKEHIKAMNLFQNDYLPVYYEDFVRYPYKTLKKVCDFIEVDYESNIWDKYYEQEKNNINGKENHKRIGKPINSDRINAWENNLTRRQKRMVERLTSPYLKKLNYDLKYSKKISDIIYIANDFIRSVWKFSIFVIKRFSKEF